MSLKGNVSLTATTVFPVYKEGTLYSVTIAANRLVTFDTEVTRGLAIFSLLSGSTEAAARDITLIYTKA